jgi:hypothetical protein
MSGRYRRRNDEAHDKRKKAYSSLEIAQNLGLRVIEPREAWEVHDLVT